MNVRGLAMMFAVLLIRMSFRPSSSDSGTGWPCNSFIFGLGSKRSSWLGAPDMNR